MLRSRLSHTLLNRTNKSLSAPKLKAVHNFVELLTWQDSQQPEQAPEPLQASDHQDFETLADQLADNLSSFLKNQVPSLPDRAISRAGIYEDHPFRTVASPI